MEEKLVIGKTYKLTDFRNFISKNYSENIVLASENQLNYKSIQPLKKPHANNL